MFARSGSFLTLVLVCGGYVAAQDPIQLPPARTAVVEPRTAPAAAIDIDIPRPPKAVVSEDVPQVPMRVPEGRGGLPQPASPPTSSPGGVGPLGPGDFRFFMNRSVTPSGANRSSRTGEPDCVILRDTAFYTGNFYAALSKDSGYTWSYINPYTRFPAADGGFCCDQRAIGVPAPQEMALWILEYRYSATTRQGRLRLARAKGRDGLRTNSWVYWDLTPAVFGQSNKFLDYSDIAVSNGYFYGSCIIGNPPNSAAGLLLYRIPLSQLYAGGRINIQYYTSSVLRGYGSYRFAQGSKSTMYWAAHVSTTKLRVYAWADSSNSASIAERSVSRWSGTPTPAPGPDGRDWTGFGYTVNTVLTGYAKSNEVGFLWTSGKVSGRPQCFVRVARFRTSDRTLIGQHDVWNPSFAFHFPAVAANSRGDVGGTIAYGGGSIYPSLAAFIVDKYSPAWAPLKLYLVRAGRAGPSSNRWGDYFSARIHSVSTRTWVATGFTRQSSTGAGEPHYAWFGRQENEPLWVTLAVNSTGISRVPITLDVTDRLGRKNGTTNFTRSYAPRQGYRLTASKTRFAGSGRYLWSSFSGSYAGTVSQTSATASLDVKDIGLVADTVNVNYVRGYALRVDSSPTGATISVTQDYYGRGRGTTSFTRYYKSGAKVALVASATFGSRRFRRWVLNGSPVTTSTTLRVTMTRDYTARAEYGTFVSGSISSFGTACGSTSHTAAPVPVVGGAEVSRLFGGTPNRALGAFWVLGTSRTRWGAIPLPANLTPYGMPGCWAYTDHAAVFTTSTDSLGRSSFVLRIPVDSSLIGGIYYTQFWAIKAVTGLGIVTTNALQHRVGGWRP